MTEKPVWTQESALHYSLRHAGKRIDVRYEAAGFQSAWGIYVGSRMIKRCTDFMQARVDALALTA
ncbi:MAG TPA: hypothetical protein VD978_04570 [Azospirillum sp.]|nr:hypothetical protein [Azospirillum sp.]